MRRVHPALPQFFGYMDPEVERQLLSQAGGIIKSSPQNSNREGINMSSLNSWLQGSFLTMSRNNTITENATYLLRTPLGAVPKGGSLAFSDSICSWFLEEIGMQTPAVYSSNLMRLFCPALPQYWGYIRMVHHDHDLFK